MAILERKIIHDKTTLCSHIIYQEFVLPRHKHPEYEIMLFTKGSGIQFVGEGTSEYKAGDIALIGSNVPHLHLCNSRLNPQSELEKCSGEALQFLPIIFPEDIATLPDFSHIASLLERSQFGLRFHSKELFEKLLEQFSEIDNLAATRRLILLYEVLEELFQCPRISVLSETPCNRANSIECERTPVQFVYDYLFNHFKENITIESLSRQVNMNGSALCRYFKKSTDKSIFQCLAEIRVEHACRLLSHSKLTISQVAYESGYNSPSHFFSQFEKLTGKTPSEYRRQIDFA